MMKLSTNFVKIAWASCLVAGLVGCGKTNYNERAHLGDGSSQRYASGETVEERIQFYGRELSVAEEDTLRAKQVFQFAFDKYEVSPEDLLALYTHAKYLIAHPDAKVRVDGHTDQVGSREYNIALGEKRAKAVKNILLFKGALAHQVDVVSYGKEKPLLLDEGDASRAQNRRAEIHYVINDAQSRAS